MSLRADESAKLSVGTVQELSTKDISLGESKETVKFIGWTIKFEVHTYYNSTEYTVQNEIC